MPGAQIIRCISKKAGDRGGGLYISDCGNAGTDQGARGSGRARARLEIVRNASPSEQHSLLIDNEHALGVARFLRDDPALRLDYTSNVTGVDWPDTVVKETTKTKQVIDGIERDIEQVIERKMPGYLEVVHHLYSMELKHGPVILRLRTTNRA